MSSVETVGEFWEDFDRIIVFLYKSVYKILKTFTPQGIELYIRCNNNYRWVYICNNFYISIIASSQIKIDTAKRTSSQARYEIIITWITEIGDIDFVIIILES